MSTAAHRRLCQ